MHGALTVVLFFCLSVDPTEALGCLEFNILFFMLLR